MKRKESGGCEVVLRVDEVLKLR